MKIAIVIAFETTEEPSDAVRQYLKIEWDKQSQTIEILPGAMMNLTLNVDVESSLHITRYAQTNERGMVVW